MWGRAPPQPIELPPKAPKYRERTQRYYGYSLVAALVMRLQVVGHRTEENEDAPTRPPGRRWV
jgi:hypothetical protein